MALYSTPVDYPITPSDAAYTANDVVGGRIALTMPTNTGLIMGATVAIGEASIAVPGTLYFYNAEPSNIADNAAFAPTHADNEKLIGKILLPTAIALNSFNVYMAKNNQSAQDGVFEYSTKTLYVYYVTTGTPNFTGAAQDINLRVHVIGEN